MADEPAQETLDKIRGAVVLAITGAARVAEVHAARRAQQLQAATRHSEQARRDIEAQQKAEAGVVKQRLQASWAKGWWDTATPEQAADAWATARAYGQIDAELAGMAVHAGEEIRRRYGVEPEKLVAAAEAVAATAPPRGQGYGDGLHEGDRAEAAAQNRAAAAETAEAVVLTVEANTVDQLVYADGVVTPTEAAVDLPAAASGWDDAARHSSLAERLARILPDAPSAQQARLTAEAAQGQPAAAATTAAAAARPAKARNVPTKGAERSMGR